MTLFCTSPNLFLSSILGLDKRAANYFYLIRVDISYFSRVRVTLRFAFNMFNSVRSEFQEIPKQMNKLKQSQ